MPNAIRRSSSASSGLHQNNVPPVKALGVTDYISDALPSKDDIYLTETLKECLKSFDLYESDQEFQHRVNVLARLDHLAKDWIKQVAVERNLPETLIEKVGGKLFTFGSYRLGVHTKGADIDTLLVAPRHVERDDFFRTFFELLNAQDETQDLRAIEDAFVPVIKVVFDGIEMDILFARLNMQTVTDETDLSDEIVLKNLHISCVRSLNGTRVTDEILKLVPDRDAFRLTLHVIKLWAKRKAIYSNVLGFLGGVSWAMLVARVCQLYPRAAPAVLVEKFFLIFSTWKWPSPVLLQRASRNPHNINLPVWDPNTTVNDRLHLLPIITPAFPEQNSTYNVGFSTKRIMTEALCEGYRLIQDIRKTELEKSEAERKNTSNTEWVRLFEEFQFFAKYRHFIVLIIQSETKSDHGLWHGLVESKIRILVQNLEKKSFVSLAHVYPRSYPVLNSPNFSTQWFIGIVFDQNSLNSTSVDLTYEIQAFSQTVHNTAYKNSLLKPGMTLEAKYVRRKELPDYLPATELRELKPRKKADSISKATPPHLKPASPLALETSEESKERKRKSSDDSQTNGLRKKVCVDSTDEESGISEEGDESSQHQSPETRLKTASDTLRMIKSSGDLVDLAVGMESRKAELLKQIQKAELLHEMKKVESKKKQILDSNSNSGSESGGEDVCSVKTAPDAPAEIRGVELQQQAPTMADSEQADEENADPEAPPSVEKSDDDDMLHPVLPDPDLMTAPVVNASEPDDDDDVVEILDPAAVAKRKFSQVDSNASISVDLSHQDLCDSTPALIDKRKTMTGPQTKGGIKLNMK